MYSPTRKVRASVRRTLFLILIGFLLGILMIDTMIEFHGNPSYPPTRSAGLMLNRSQMLLAKEILLEPHRFSCRSAKTYPLYIVVKTRAVTQDEYFQRRMFARTSWARDAHAMGVPVIYAVGRPTDQKIQQLLEDEHRQYGDLLQFNYIDAYYNITIKSTGILHWFSRRNCRLFTRYLFVVDDDVLINIPVLLHFIHSNQFQLNTFYGLYLADIEPHPSGKWSVSLTDYPNRTYPSFITGASTLYPSNLIDRVVEKIFEWVEENRPILFLDDVLISGMIADQLSIARAPMWGIEDCSFTDLYSRTIISECNHLRRIYVWSKFLLRRFGQTTFHIDRLIEQKTIYLKWHADFKHTRNGTALVHRNIFDKVFLLDSQVKLGWFICLALLLIYLPKLILVHRQQQKSSNGKLLLLEVVQN